VLFAGMMEYDGDTHTPALPGQPARHRPHHGRVHGQRDRPEPAGGQRDPEVRARDLLLQRQPQSGKFSEKLEDYVEIKSDRLPFEQRPWMKAAEITDVVLESIRGNRHKFIRINFPNGDMVGPHRPCCRRWRFPWRPPTCAWAG
jgi:2,3-bisphosphoglycerate-independent phosphoglycerate mutase